jgi:hypothetical protein
LFEEILVKKERCVVSSFGLGILLLASTEAAAAPRGPDFDNDGFDDLLIGVPFESVSTQTDAGSVNVLYGGSSGIEATLANVKILHQNITNAEDAAEGYDYFGLAVAWGDFDGDCFDDIAVGVPGEDLGNPVVASAGMVQVFYGSATGPSTSNDELWHRGVANIDGDLDTLESFGDAVAVGDFNGDGFDDLVAGVPDADIGAELNAGAVHVIYGSAFGLSATATRADQSIDQSWLGVGGDPVNNERFGSSLATGDFDCDGFEDLAVGASFQTVSGVSSAGTVTVIYGTANGLDPAFSTQVWSQNSTGVLDFAEGGDLFGTTLTAGNFNGDSSASGPCMDLAIYAREDDVGGAVHILYGTSGSGLQASSPDDDQWHQNSGTILDTSEAGDNFGVAMVVGRFNSDGFDDLAIGVPGEDVGTGAVAIVLGSASGLVTTDNVRWTQDTSLVGEAREQLDYFGDALAYGARFNNDSLGDLAVGVPGETYTVNNTTFNDAGIVQVIYTATTVSPPVIGATSHDWKQAHISGESNEDNDNFGYVLARSREKPFCD